MILIWGLYASALHHHSRDWAFSKESVCSTFIGKCQPDCWLLYWWSFQLNQYFTSRILLDRIRKGWVYSCNNHGLQQLVWGCESNGHECRVTTYSICCNEHLITIVYAGAHWRGHFLDPGAAVQVGQNIQGTTSVVGDPAYHNCIWLCTYMNATGVYRT